MGQGNSKEQQALKKKKKAFYAPPDYRLRTRFDSVDNTQSISSFEAGIDKFDYLLVFPLVQGEYSKLADQYDYEDQLVSWEEIQRIWVQSSPGTDEDKKATAEDLADFFFARTKIDPRDITNRDYVGMKKFLTVAREKIIEDLLRRGLQLKLTATRSFIFCQIRAPILLLETQADSENYKLQYRGEVDPGSKEFWNVEVDGIAVEVEEEKKIYSVAEANEILEKLYRAGKISANDVGVNSLNEIPTAFSRRVHTLERIADKVMVTNKYPAYCSFSSQRQLRHLYQEYPSIRGRSLFRYKDRLYLTKAILDQCYDFGVLDVNDVIEGCFALHDANRGDPLTIDLLLKRWVTFWRVSAKDAGSTMVSDESMENGDGVWFYLRPWAQPLNDIREYFGEKISLYFAWMGHYTFSLIIPAVLGSLMELVCWIRGYQDSVDQIDWYLSTFNVLMVIWNGLYKQSWKRECTAVSYKWGTNDTADKEKNRPQFYGDEEKPLVRSLIDNTQITNFPEERRNRMVLLSYLVVFMMIVLNVATIGCTFFIEYLVINVYTEYYFDNFVWYSSFLQAFIIPISSYFFLSVATVLNDFENYPTDSVYENALIKKSVYFQVFNSFGALLFDAFLRGPLLNTCTPNCITDLRILMYAIIIVRSVVNGVNIAIPFVYMNLMQLINSFYASADEDKQALTGESAAEMEFVNEVYREEHNGTFDDYSQAVIQYGYVCMFYIAMPIIGIIALGENLLKIRSDAYRLCALTRRPNVVVVQNIGMWEELMDTMSHFGVIISVGIICFTGESLDMYSTTTIAIIFLVYECSLFILKWFVESLSPVDPEWLRTIQLRTEYITKKFFEGVDNNDDDLDTSNMKKMLNDTIDVDTLVLSELRETPKNYQREYWHREKTMAAELEAQRREIQKNLRIAKENLEFAYKYERFNPKAGVGENLQGLPIARLIVKVCEIRMAEKEIRELTRDYGPYEPMSRVRVTFKAFEKNSRVAIAPPLGPNSYTPNGEITKTNPLSILLNHDMSFAPIRGIDADVVFDVLHTPKDKSEKMMYTTSVSLTELMDQEVTYKVLTLLIKTPNDSVQASGSDLHVQLQFQYSKIVPYRATLADWRQKLNAIESKLSKVKAGRIDFSGKVVHEVGREDEEGGGGV